MTDFKKLSIVFITNNWHPFNAGVVSSIVSYRKELERQGHRVTLITLDFDGKQEQGVTKLFCPLRSAYRGIPLAIPFCATWQIWRQLKAIKPDIVHCHHPFLLGVAGLRAARFLKIPVVFTYHSLYEKYIHYAPCAQKLLTRWVRSRVQWFCKNVNGIITPGQETIRLLVRDGVTTPHVLLPSPLQTSYLDQDLKTHIDRNSNKPFHLMTCSRFVKEKNIPFLLDMFALLDQRKFTFTLAGFGSELESLKKYAYETLKLSPDVVKFANHLNVEALKKVYAQSDVFIFASLADTQGLVLAEAMASGLPVVALNGPGQEDIIENGVNGFLIENISEMATGLKLIANDNELLHRLRVNAYATAQRYTSELLTHTLLEFYQKIMS